MYDEQKSLKQASSSFSDHAGISMQTADDCEINIMAGLQRSGIGSIGEENSEEAHAFCGRCFEQPIADLCPEALWCS